MSRTEKLTVRGYLERIADGEWFGICLTLNLPVRGRSKEEVEHKLDELVSAYLTRACKQGKLDEAYPRKAPISYYLRYYFIAFKLIILRL